MEIKIGDKVIVETDIIGPELATVLNKYVGQGMSTVYQVQFYNMSTMLVSEEDVKLAKEEMGANPEEYELKIDVAENLVIAMLLKNGEQIARGHGHIIHGGDIGIAQAISYACKRIWFELGGNYDDK